MYRSLYIESFVKDCTSLRATVWRLPLLQEPSILLLAFFQKFLGLFCWPLFLHRGLFTFTYVALPRIVGERLNEHEGRGLAFAIAQFQRL